MINFTEMVQEEIQILLLDLSILHPFFCSHPLIHNLGNEIREGLAEPSYITNDNLINFRKDIATAIGELAKKTLNTSPSMALVRIAEQNILSVGFKLVSNLICNKELQAYQRLSVSMKDKDYDNEIAKIIELAKQRNV